MEAVAVVIAGPTCSGKTDLALLMAEKLSTEIISADSRQLYRKLDIGTAKPDAEELAAVRHHFINCCNPDESYNVSRFEQEAEAVMKNLFGRGKIPIIAGGSGLYIKALIDGIIDLPSADEEFRKDLQRQRTEFGNEFLYDKLKKVDPESASNMLPQNWKRVMRALEVITITGIPIWKHQQMQQKKTEYSFRQFGLAVDRDRLYKNIEKRVDAMIERGLVDEVNNVLDLGYSKSLNSLNTVGYKEIISYLEGTVTLERAVELIKRNTRRYAKRQMTWFRADKRIEWIDIESRADIKKAAAYIIKKVKN